MRFQAILVFIALSQAVSAQPVQWPTSITANAANAERLIESTWATAPSDQIQLNRLGDQFDAELNAIASASSGSLLSQAQQLEGEDFTAKLIVLADYRQKQIVRINEIRQWLWPPPSQNDRSRAAKRPLPIHPAIATEDYRLAWEYLLLRPNYQRSDIVQHVINEALVLAENPSSVLTLARSIRSSLTATALPGRDRERLQKDLVWGLAGMPNPWSLQALLNFPDWVVNAPGFIVPAGANDQWRIADPDLPNYPIKALEKGIFPVTQMTWQNVMNAYTNQVSPAQAQRLQSYLSAVSP